jgi:hypothetical protein
MRLIRVIEDWIIIGLFAIAVLFPLVRTRYKTDLTPSFEENRPLAQFPQLSMRPGALIRFPRDFGNYFNDHFAFRRMLIRWQALARVKWLGDSSSPSVILGKDGWLFDGANIGLRQGAGPLTEDQIARWQQVLIARKDWLAARGIKYLFVVVPGKGEVYPEFLPEFGLPSQVSRQDQLIAALRGSTVEILDLRPSLLAAKHAQLVYLKTDTHWNSFGSFVGYETIIKELSRSFPVLHPLAESDLQFSRPSTVSGNLARMLGLYDSITEQVIGVSTGDSQPIVDGNSANPNEMAESEQQAATLPRLVMFRDSFSTSMIPFLSRHFSRAVYVWQQQLDRQLIETEHPAVVIQEVYEGLVEDYPPPDVPSTSDRKSAGSAPGLPAFQGTHSIINCAGTMGWAWDKSRPNESIKVDVYDGYQPLASIKAGAFLQSLFELGIGNGRHGFSFPLPAQVKDGKPHEIRIRFAGTNLDLEGTPLQIRCESE